MVVSFLYHIVHKDSFTVFIICSRCCRSFCHNRTLSNLSLALIFSLILKHTCTHVLFVSIDYNNNNCYIYKPFASTHISISTLKIHQSRIYLIDTCRSRRDILSPREAIGAVIWDFLNALHLFAHIRESSPRPAKQARTTRNLWSTIVQKKTYIRTLSLSHIHTHTHTQ